jgi:hypothetical protein
MHPERKSIRADDAFLEMVTKNQFKLLNATTYLRNQSTLTRIHASSPGAMDPKISSAPQAMGMHAQRFRISLR